MLDWIRLEYKRKDFQEKRGSDRKSTGTVWGR